MNSPAVLKDIALTKQLSDGTIQWVPLKGPAQQETASAGVSYTLIDRSNSYEAPQSLRLERRDEDLIVSSEGAELLIITDFFAAEGVSFYPEPDIASGAGPFSGPAITPDTETVRESSDGPLIVWSDDSDARDGRAEQEATPTVKEGGVSPWLWVGGGLGLLGIAAAAGGGGGGGGDDTPTFTPTPPAPSDTTPPEITSSATAAAIDENSSAGQVVYSAAATDAAAVTWSLTGTDAAFFSIDAGTGDVTLIDNPDFETQPSYEFTVVATDAAGNQSEQQVSLAVNDLNDAAPRITSGATAVTIDENSGPNQAIYTATAEGSVTWSLGTGGDTAQLSINASNGVVTLATNPDHETQSGFSFTVIATDADGNRAEQPVNLLITDLDEVAPTITSGAATQSIDENTGAGQVVYTATSTDQGDISSDPISYSLALVGDAAAFSIDPASGAVTLDENPNFETQPRYDFTVVATDGAGNSTQQSVSLVVNDLDDSAPFISSGAIANPINENSGANQTIYTATAEAGVTWSLDAGANSAELSIDASTGVVTLTPDPDHETQADYTFTVIATDAAGNSSQQIVSLAINDLDEVAPTITSSATANALNENSGAGQVVYTATSTDTGDISTGPIQYSLAPGDDAAAFSIAATSGAVTLIENPDFETLSSYTFTVIATDAAGNSTQQTVSLSVNDVDENAPPITSGATAAPIDENSGAGQAIYNATAGETVTWSLAPGGDSGAFSIDTSTGEVTFAIDPDHETQPSFAFTVVATNAAGNSSQQTVSLAINDLDEVAPTITSLVTANALNENSGPGQVVYTATSTDAGDISTGPIQYSLAPGDDAAAFSIAATSGAVTLIENPDFETLTSYTFTVIATDTAGNSTQQSVSLAVNDIDENAPPITSGATATPIDENSGAGQAIYNATAGEAVTWSLAPGGDAAAFSIDTNTGEVTFAIDPDHETQPSFTFSVVATNAVGNSSQQAVSLTINDLDEVAPTITSPATAAAINENSGAGQVVYITTSTDAGDINTGPVQYSLGPGPDAAAFSISATTGAVTLIDDPDFETQSSYTFTVIATDAAGNSSQQSVSLTVNDVDEIAPPITSGATASPIDENSGTDQPIYTATAGDAVTWSLAPGGDAGAFSIDVSTGIVTLNIDPDHETQPSYAFTVIATNDAGNSSQQTVSLAINDLDEVAPTITSLATADAIDENSGANQVVYRATSTDSGDISTGSTTYSLAAGTDSADFSINAITGVVRLTADPDFEVQSSYAFTVVATDAAGNSSQQAVTLNINDVDETPPTLPSIVSVVLTDALGAENDVLNAGDTVRATVTLDTPVTVDVTGGTPQISLEINDTAVLADFVTGGGPDELRFEYVIQAGENDDDGISIPANAINANGGLITDALGNAADLDHAAIADNGAFVVDTTAPTLASSSPADDDIDVLVGADVVLTFAESVTAASGNITISDGTDTRVIDVTDASQVAVNGAVVTINPVADLNPDSTYNVQVDADAFVDTAGNGYAGISTAAELNFDTETGADPTIVVFDLIGGDSSSHSGRQFDAGTSYDIYVLVDSDSATLATVSSAQQWSGADNLGTDDRIILVGDGADVEGPAGPVGVVNGVVVDTQFAAWQTAGDTAAIFEGGTFDRTTAAGNNSAQLFTNSADSNFFGNQNTDLSTRYLTDLPTGILTSQGLV